MSKRIIISKNTIKFPYNDSYFADPKWIEDVDKCNQYQSIKISSDVLFDSIYPKAEYNANISSMISILLYMGFHSSVTNNTICQCSIHELITDALQLGVFSVNFDHLLATLEKMKRYGFIYYDDDLSAAYKKRSKYISTVTFKINPMIFNPADNDFTLDIDTYNRIRKDDPKELIVYLDIKRMENQGFKIKNSSGLYHTNSISYDCHFSKKTVDKLILNLQNIGVL